VFDLSIPKLPVLTVIALVIFGPDQLPKITSQADNAPATRAGSPRAHRTTCGKDWARSSPAPRSRT